MVKNMNKTVKKILIGFIISVFSVISLVLIFNKPIGTQIVKNNQTTAMQHLNRKDILKNQKKPGQYDFSKVKSINGVSAMRSRFSGNPTVIGAISIPAVGLQLPICKGLSDVNMSTGASTMRQDQVMGEGNYPLAGHYMTRYGALFSPIEQTQVGEKVYLTDLKNVYTYQIYEKKDVTPKSVYLVDNTAEKQVTLITCADGGANRWAVRAKLINTQKANDRALKVFEI